jgi:DNA-damage-inducible protein J
MTKTASMYLRIDPQVKSDVEAIYSRYGLSVTDAINVFLYQSRNVGGLPFNLRYEEEPNPQTIKSIRAGNKILKSGKGRFKNAEDLLKDLKK